MRTITLIIIHCSATPEGKSLSAEACRQDHILHRGFRDIGYHFPDTSAETLDMDSKVILRKTIDLIATRGYHLVNIDATICAEQPKINPHIPAMAQCMADVIGCDADMISIKATTSERMGFVGRQEGMAAYAVCLIEKKSLRHLQQ